MPSRVSSASGSQAWVAIDLRCDYLRPAPPDPMRITATCLRAGRTLAVADVRVLTRALVDFYKHNKRERLARYSETCLRRVWKVQRFSWWMTSMLHRFPNEDSFSHNVHLAELDYLTSSRAAAQALAENYVGLPFDES